MSKTELIEHIMRLNRSATEEFLHQFSPNQLDLYLRKLLKAAIERGPNLLQPEPWPLQF